MGRILFIRVKVETFAVKDVVKAWPLLCALVWPDSEAGAALSGKTARASAASAGQGALELVDALLDFARFGDMPQGGGEPLHALARRLEALRESLDDALGDRNVPAAQKTIDAIENTLDEAEKTVYAIKGKLPDAFR
ncbi:MAG: hypothetical protein LBD42_07920 [Desulfovibrio sp.]|jgi:hypothetical protein|nr:hypothetical protein [Desulfovibrio sp.]